MASPKKHNLGVFAAGEIPFPIDHRFTALAVPIPLTGFTAFVYIEGPEGDVVLGQGIVTITDAPNGLVRYVWDEDDMQLAGKYRMLIWVDDPDNRFASDLIVWEVYDGPGPTPEGI